MLSLVVVAILLSASLSLKPVKRFLGSEVSALLNEKYEVNLSIEEIDLSYLGTIGLANTLIIDEHQDTLIALEYLESSLVNIHNLMNNNLNLNNVILRKGVFNLKTYQGESRSNFNTFIDHFRSTKDQEKKAFILKGENFELFNISFFLNDENKNKSDLVSYDNISGGIDHLYVYPKSVEIGLRSIGMRDNYDINYDNLSVDFQYTSSEMRFMDLDLKTEFSHIKGDIICFYEGPEDLKKFGDNVILKGEFEPSYVSVIELSKFVPLIESDQVLSFNSGLEGTLNDFYLDDFDLTSDSGLELKGDFEIVNLIDKNKSPKISAEIEFTEFTYSNLKETFPTLIGQYLPSVVENLGTVVFQGNLDFEDKKLNSKLVAKTDLGGVVTSIELGNLGNKEGEISYVGELILEDFDIGTFAKDSRLNRVSLKADIEGEGFQTQTLGTSFSGDIFSIDILDYTYKNIYAVGDFYANQFEGRIEVRDDNLNVDFSGLANLSSELNNFDFKAAVDFANLYELGFVNRDSISVFKGDLDIDIVGNSFDNIIGVSRFDNITYQSLKQEYYFETLQISSSNKNGVKSIRVESNDVIDGYLNGYFNFADIPKLFTNTIGYQLNKYEPEDLEDNQYLNFEFNIYKKVVELFLPQVRVSENTFIKGVLKDEDELFQLDYKAPELLIGKNYFKDISLGFDTESIDTLGSLKVGLYKNDKYEIQDLDLSNFILQDTLYFDTHFVGGTDKSEEFDLDFYFSFEENNQGVFGFRKSEINFRDNIWFINQENDFSSNRIDLDFNKKIYNISKISVGYENQFISIEGMVRDSTHKDLSISIREVELADVSPYVDSLSLDGLIDGNIEFVQEEGYYTPTGDLLISNLKINDSEQGDLQAQIESVDGSLDKYFLGLNLKREAFKGFSATGFIDLEGEVPSIDLDSELDQFKLDLFSPLGKQVLSKIRGTASGSFKLQGPLNNPNMDGVLTLSGAGLKFPYLNIDFDFVGEPQILLSNQSFNLEDLYLRDTKYQTEGTLSGRISHNRFADWNLELNIRTKKLLALDTQETETSLFYGTAFIDGNANISGLAENLTIDVTARTLKGTEFIIPLSDVKTVEQSDLISFKSKGVKSNLFDYMELSEFEKVKGLSMNFNLDITKDAVAEIVIDKKSGSSLRGSGTGNLVLEIDTNGKFNMFGDFTIDQGNYNFSYRGIINKLFKARKGGTISWTGNPYSAELNIEAVHTVYANPKSLLENLNTNRRIQVDLVTRISGPLSSTEQEYDIVIPNSSSTVSNELNFILNNNDSNERLRQFFWLLGTKNFYNENNNANVGGSAITGTTSDLISGFLSDMLNSPDSKLQLDVGYSVADKSAVDNLNLGDQFDIAGEIQLSDRVLINGNMGIPVGTGSDNSVVGEVKVEFLMNEEGSFRTTIFNRQNEIQYSDEEEGYTQGVGMSYQIDFDRLSEVWAKFRKKKKRITQPEDMDNLQNEKFKDLIYIVPNGF